MGYRLTIIGIILLIMVLFPPKVKAEDFKEKHLSISVECTVPKEFFHRQALNQ